MTMGSTSATTEASNEAAAATPAPNLAPTIFVSFESQEERDVEKRWLKALHECVLRESKRVTRPVLKDRYGTSDGSYVNGGSRNDVNDSKELII